MFAPDPITTLTPLYALALLLLAAAWLLDVRRHARAGQQPALALLGGPGLGALGAAPLLDTPALFGVGAALLLLAHYPPQAYVFRPLPTHRLPTHRAQMLLWAGALVAAPAAVALPLYPAAGLALVTVLMAALTATALGLGTALSPRAPAAPTAPELGLKLRFAAVTVPPTPELELRLDGERAHLLNISSGTLLLAGWSPGAWSEPAGAEPGEPEAGGGRLNGWLSARDAHGAPLSRLPSGAEAHLWPWPQDARRLNVWYVHEGAPGEPRVFRAEWTPPGAGPRVLN